MKIIKVKKVIKARTIIKLGIVQTKEKGQLNE